MKVVLFILFLVALIAFGPLLVIWSLNTLFGLSIQYTFWTWMAAIILASTINAGRSESKKK